MSKCYYCPICGIVSTSENEECNYCDSEIGYFESKRDIEYYKSRARKLYNDQIHWRKVVVEEEAKNNSLFEIDQYNFSHSEDGIDKVTRKTIRQSIQEINNPDKNNIPKCPTCNSANIKRISGMKRAFHGYAFGIFSKTAFSQFECQNCGYKW